MPGALRNQPPEHEEGEEGEVRHHLEGPPVPDVVGLQAQEHLTQGEGDLDGDPDEGCVPGSHIFNGEDEGDHERPDAAHARQEAKEAKAARSLHERPDEPGHGDKHDPDH